MYAIPLSYWRNVHDGHALLERGVVPRGQALQLSHIAEYAREPELRKLARQAVVRFKLGELIGERRGVVG